MNDQNNPNDPQGPMDGSDFAETQAEVLTAEERAAEQPLNLAEDDRLPWLESAEDYDEDDGSTGRILGLVILGLIALAVVVGAVYWTQNRGPEAPQGDGSLIAAPEGDYKTQPEDAQVTEVEGTGDASFAASQGQKSEGQLGDSTTRAAAAGGVLIQLGAFNSQASAQTGWSSLSRKYDFISGTSNRIVSADVDGGTVYRLSAVAPNINAANTLCARLKKVGENCFVVR